MDRGILLGYVRPRVIGVYGRRRRNWPGKDGIPADEPSNKMVTGYWLLVRGGERAREQLLLKSPITYLGRLQKC